MSATPWRLHVPRAALAATLVLAPLVLRAQPSPGGAAAGPVEVAPGVHLLSGHFVAGEQPDGNSVIFAGTDGLVVIDTGRHPAHTQAIVDFARLAQAPVTAVVNTHWHLDHIGGNPLLRQAFPGLKVYASGALAGALKGFLAEYRKDLAEQIQKTPNARGVKSWQAEIAIIDGGAAIAPDQVIARSGEYRLAGRSLDLELETYAVTAGDLWVFDAKTRVLASGDLVTLPVPFLDTACPQRWKVALDHLAQRDFEILIPGHGAPMHRKEFETYRRAFGALLGCSASNAAKEDCIAGWLRDAAPLLSGEDPKSTRGLLDYYIDNQLRGDRTQAAKLCAP